MGSPNTVAVPVGKAGAMMDIPAHIGDAELLTILTYVRRDTIDDPSYRQELSAELLEAVTRVCRERA